jgi:hypothetical protein
MIYVQWSFRIRWFLLILIIALSTSLAQASSPGKNNLPNPGYYNLPPSSEEASADDTTAKTKKVQSNLIDLRFNTAVKCLLLGPPPRTATTRNSHSRADDDSGPQPEPLFPTKGQKHAHIFATAERRHETNYLGMLFRWKSTTTKSNKKRGLFIVPPTTTDVASQWTLDGNFDSLSLQLDWGSGGGDNKNIYCSPHTQNDSPIVEVRANNARRLTQLGCRFPIVFRRLHLWSIVHLPWNSDSFENPIFHTGPITPPSPGIDLETTNNKNNDEWWIPNIVADPIGMVTTDNQYTKPLHHRHQQQPPRDHHPSFLKVRLRLRSRLSFLSSTVMGITPDDDSLDGSTIMSLECSHIDTQNCHSTTGRLEVPMELLSLLTSWKQNPLLVDSRLSIIHERLLTKGIVMKE